MNIYPVLIIFKILLIIALSFVSSCAVIEKYPNSWNDLIQADSGCMDIAGNYYDKGVTASGNNIRIGWSLFPEIWPLRWTDKALVEIKKISPDEIKLIYLLNNNVLSERVLSLKRGEFRCNERGVYIDMPFHRTNSKMLYAGSWGKSYLSKDDFGDLYINAKITTIGLFLIIPLGGIDHIWGRFSVKKH